MKKENIDEYTYILKTQGIDLEKKHIFWKNKDINREMFIANALNVRMNPNGYPKNRNYKFQLRPMQIYYLNNICVSKRTKSAILWPLILFSTVSLISLTMGALLQWEGKLGFSRISENAIILILFFGILFFILAVILAIQFFGKTTKAVLKKKGNHFVVKKMSTKNFDDLNSKLLKNVMNHPICFHRLDTPRTIIREFRELDQKDVLSVLSDPEFHKCLFTNPIKTKDESYRFINNALIEYSANKPFKFAIENKESHKVIGYIGISKHRYTPLTCEIIYGLDKKYWHHGYITEILPVFLDYLKQKGFTYVFGGHIEENEFSGLALIRAGFFRDEKRDYKIMIKNSEYKIKSYILSFIEEVLDEENEE